METLIITSTSNQGLNDKIKSYTEQGYRVVGTHQVVETHHQNRFRGNQHVDTIIEREYSITMIKHQPTDEDIYPTLKVGIYYRYRDSRENVKIYDEDEMRNEFEEKLSNLINPL